MNNFCYHLGPPGRIIRVHWPDQDLVEFVMLGKTPSCDELKILEDTVKNTMQNMDMHDTPDAETFQNMLEHALHEFTNKTGHKALICIAPYVYDIEIK